MFKNLSMESVEKLRWVTLLFQIIIGSALTFTYLLGVYVGPLSQTYGWSINGILVTFTIAIWVGSPAMVIGGKIRDKLGNRLTIILGGAVYGIAIFISGSTTSLPVFIVMQGIVASSMLFVVYCAQMTNIGELFPGNRGFAVGLLTAGTSLGTAIMSPLAVYFMQHFSVASSLHIQGIIYGVICVIFGFLVINAPKGFRPKNMPEEEEIELTGDAVETGKLDVQINWRELLKSPALYLFILGFILVCLITSAFMSNLPLMVQTSTGISEMQSATMVSAYSIALGVGGIIFGFLADRFGLFKMIYITAAAMFVIPLVVALFAIENVTAWYILTVLVGGACGCYSTMMAALTMNCFGARNFGVNYGIVGVASMIHTAIAPQVSASMSASTTLIIFAVTSVAGIFVMMITKKAITKLVQQHQEKVAAGLIQE